MTDINSVKKTICEDKFQKRVTERAYSKKGVRDRFQKMVTERAYCKNGTIDKDRFQKMIAERAYCKSEKRGFIGGHEMEDWLEAEWEIKNQYFYWFQDTE